MLPTPETSHVSFDTIYEPAEDSYLLLDTLSSPPETAWLKERFSTPHSSPSPLLLEIGTGSGVVVAFLTANAHSILGRSDVLALGTDVNRHACLATNETVKRAIQDGLHQEQKVGGRAGTHLATLNADLTSPVRPGELDILIFNPPYVPTDNVPSMPPAETTSGPKTVDQNSMLLELSYAGGVDGMEVTNRLLAKLPDILSERGVAYILLCAQNKIPDVDGMIKGWGASWGFKIVGKSGAKGGWERLSIVRIWREGRGGK
jgi:release factor glutamine methyltransferase